MNVFALPLGAFFLATQPVSIDFESLRFVAYYESRFYVNAEPPFTWAPPEVVLRTAITEERIEEALAGHNLVIEVCLFIRDAPTAAWRVPTTLSERREHCEVHGSFEPEQQP